MTVYIELLIIDNFMLDYLIGYTTLAFLKVETSMKKLLLSAAVGTAFAVFLPYIPYYIAIPYKLAALAGSVIVLRHFKSAKKFYATLLIYALVSVVLAGIIVLAFNMKASSIMNTFVYDKGGLIGISAFAAILLLYCARQIKGLLIERSISESVAKVDLVYGNIAVTTNGLLDTGNRLKDDKGQGVVILGGELSQKFRDCPKGNMLSVTTINGQSEFDTVILEKIKIYYRDKSNTINYVCAALTERHFEGYEVILFTGGWEDLCS
ncbi:MAG: hypothetical protein EOM87_04440 [Clostridia bacterium]|nr:hypothetical protein [Clostridia bacterium]